MIPYFRTGLLIGFLVLVGFIFFYRGQAIYATSEKDKALAALTEAQRANERNEAVLMAVQAMREENDRLATELFKAVGEINAGLVTVQTDINELEKSNEAVKDYLNTAIPSDLAELLNRNSNASEFAPGSPADDASKAGNNPERAGKDDK